MTDSGKIIPPAITAKPTQGYSIEQIAEILQPLESRLAQPAEKINRLTLDSRIARPNGSLFFAIKGSRHDGHDYLTQLIERGFKNFVVERLPEDIVKNNGELASSCNFLQVENSVAALQKLAAAHRKTFAYPLIAITGSNGKTIVKEWLAQLTSKHLRVIKSPRSFNSQVGVPLSLWEMKSWHQLAIIEAGISQPGEMHRLQQIIQPTLGIFTNLGAAHDAGFDDRAHKLQEKLKLFTDASKIIFNADDPQITAAIPAEKAWGWTTSNNPKAQLSFRLEKSGSQTLIQFDQTAPAEKVRLPFTDAASVENALHCLAVALYLDLPIKDIKASIAQLEAPEMRLELLKGAAGNLILNDAYSNDLLSLELALEYLETVSSANSPRALILSDIPESKLDSQELYSAVGKAIEAAAIKLLITVGEKSSAQIPALPDCKHLRFETVNELLNALDSLHQSGIAIERHDILVKGARRFQFERIVRKLEAQVHSTVLEVNLTALEHNLNTYRQHISTTDPAPAIMGMVKALSYGSGQREVARLLEYNRVDYLAVAYPDEGFALRSSDVGLPIMVMNAERTNLSNLFDAELEPEIYSLRQLEGFEAKGQRNFPIHLKLDTGMHRLGFRENELPALLEYLHANPQLQVRSIFSHLSSSDEPAQDNYSRQQIAAFRDMSSALIEKLAGSNPSPLLHLLNSAGALRFPEARFDMVRLGIGMYGYDPTGLISDQLQVVSRLRTTISQLKSLSPGETAGYSRSGEAEKDMRIATIGIGYADGLRRSLGNGVGAVAIRGQLAPIFGNVCMDMCMVDVSHISNVAVGDEAEIFGSTISISTLAAQMGTIPYEVLTAVSARVKRVYFRD